jgi:hypothetical protein
MTLANPLVYPLVNGVKHSLNSVELKINGRIYIGFKSINYSRKRNRTMVRGKSPDPIAKAIGENEYSGDCELYLAEFNLMQDDLGPGYGDIPFTVYATWTQNGFDTITDVLLGCNLDSTESNNSGADPTVRKFDLSPLKILFNGIDDLAVPLVAPPQ